MRRGTLRWSKTTINILNACRQCKHCLQPHNGFHIVHAQFHRYLLTGNTLGTATMQFIYRVWVGKQGCSHISVHRIRNNRYTLLYGTTHYRSVIYSNALCCTGIYGETFIAATELCCAEQYITDCQRQRTRITNCNAFCILRHNGNMTKIDRLRYNLYLRCKNSHCTICYRCLQSLSYSITQHYQRL